MAVWLSFISKTVLGTNYCLSHDELTFICSLVSTEVDVRSGEPRRDDWGDLCPVGWGDTRPASWGDTRPVSWGDPGLVSGVDLRLVDTGDSTLLSRGDSRSAELRDVGSHGRGHPRCSGGNDSSTMVTDSGITNLEAERFYKNITLPSICLFKTWNDMSLVNGWG